MSGPTETCSVDLATGQLRVEVDQAELPLSDLCDFATRRNPKRGFLFVSKVLGRHWPARPSVMRGSYARLAAKLPADLPGPVLFVGMAETAIALGTGVFHAYLQRTGRDDGLYLHSTRYRLGHPLALTFGEDHSHAAEHLLYEPPDPHCRQRFHAARSLVIVDDECSTGATLANLAHALAIPLKQLSHVHAAVLTDWRGLPPEPTEASPTAVQVHSLLQGRYSFDPHRDAHRVEMPSLDGNGARKDHLLPHNFGRLGIDRSPELPRHVVDQLAALPLEPDQRVLVLGSGEFVFPPLLVAEWLEQQGAVAFCQATTRSPVRVGGAIGHALSFPDHVEDGIENYLYNAERSDYDRIVACFETPQNTVPPPLIDELGATPVLF